MCWKLSRPCATKGSFKPQVVCQKWGILMQPRSPAPCPTRGLFLVIRAFQIFLVLRGRGSPTTPCRKASWRGGKVAFYQGKWHVSLCDSASHDVHYRALCCSNIVSERVVIVVEFASWS